MKSVPDAKYRCMRCRFEWVGYRVLPDKDRVYWRYDDHQGRGMTDCPKCHNMYVEWLNWEEIRRTMGKEWDGH